MRDLAKSMMSCGWALSIFGVQQMFHLMMPAHGGDSYGKATKAFNDVTNAAVGSLDASMKSTYEAGKSLQSGMIDMMFSGMMSAGLDPNRWMSQMADLGKRATQPAGAASGSAPGQGPAPAGSSGLGWGPMPR